MAYTVTITGTGSTDCCVRINGTDYWGSTTLTVNAGDEITCIAIGSVILNGTTVAKSSSSSTVSYVLTVVNNVQIALDASSFLNYKVTITMEVEPEDPTAPKDGHNVLIDGAACQIESGTVMIGGTVYEIEKGEVLIGGTVYEIPFKAATVKLILSTDINTTNERVTVDSQSYTTAGEYEIEQGSTIAFAVKASNSRYTSTIKLNGTTVVSMSSTSWKSYEVVADTDVTVSSNTVGQGTVSNRTGALIITTS